MDATSLDATTRSVLRKKVKALRRSGATPLHLYGQGKPSQALQASSSTVTRVVSKVGQHTPLFVRLDGATEQELVFVREIQRDPVTNGILHVDLLRVDVANQVRAEVPLAFTGEAPAIKTHGAVLSQIMHRVAVEALPMEMPDRVEVDLSGLEDLDQVIRISDLNSGPGVTLLGDPEEVVARLNAPRVSGDRSDAPSAVGDADAATPPDEDTGD